MHFPYFFHPYKSPKFTLFIKDMRKTGYITILFLLGWAMTFSQASTSLHRAYLDSAVVYKRNDIEKSIDFITHSITALGKRADKKALAESLAALGDVYQFHNQYDLAITNYKDANEANRSSRTTIKLGTAYIFNKEYDKAESVLTPLTEIDNLIPFQRVELFENLGDAYTGLGQIDRAVAL